MKVYIVLADLWSVSDLVAKDESLDILTGYNAGEIRAVFDTREAAENFRNEMAAEVNELAEEEDFIPMEYTIEEWEVNGKCAAQNLK